MNFIELLADKVDKEVVLFLSNSGMIQGKLLSVGSDYVKVKDSFSDDDRYVATNFISSFYVS